MAIPPDQPPRLVLTTGSNAHHSNDGHCAASAAPTVPPRRRRAASFISSAATTRFNDPLSCCGVDAARRPWSFLSCGTSGKRPREACRTQRSRSHRARRLSILPNPARRRFESCLTYPLFAPSQPRPRQNPHGPAGPPHESGPASRSGLSWEREHLARMDNRGPSARCGPDARAPRKTAQTHSHGKERSWTRVISR